MLKSKYSTLNDIPEGDRQHYTLQDGTYILQLDSDHPVLAKNGQLLGQHATDKAELQRLNNELASTQSELSKAQAVSGIPRGHVAIPNARAATLDTFEAIGTPDEVKAKLKEIETFASLGKKPEEIVAALQEHATLKASVAAFEKQKHFAEVAGLLGYPAVDVFSTLPGVDEVEFEIKSVTKDGKVMKEVEAKFKEDGKDVVKTASDFVPERWPNHMPALRPVDAKGIKMVKQGNGDKPTPTNIFDAIRAEEKAKQDAATAKRPSLEERLHMV